MARSLIPPRGIFVSSKLLFDKSLPPVVRDTAIQIASLAWGAEETPPVSISEISELTGKSIPTLYSHMGLLRDRGALRWRPAGTSTIIVTLLDGVLPLSEPEVLQSNSEKLELLDLSSIPIKQSRKKKINTSNSENSESLENQNSNAGTVAIREKYCELLGYMPDDWSNGEGAAAKAIGAKYTVDDFERVYTHMKSQKFWQDKHIMLRQIKPQMQGVLAYLSKNGNGKGTHAIHQGNSSDDDAARECAERINRRNGK